MYDAGSKLTLVQLEGIQSAALADDVPIADFDKMSKWSEAEARVYFESGGETEPTVAAVHSSLAPAFAPLGRKARIVFLGGTATNLHICKMQTMKLARRRTPPLQGTAARYPAPPSAARHHSRVSPSIGKSHCACLPRAQAPHLSSFAEPLLFIEGHRLCLDSNPQAPLL